MFSDDNADYLKGLEALAGAEKPDYASWSHQDWDNLIRENKRKAEFKAMAGRGNFYARSQIEGSNDYSRYNALSHFRTAAKALHVDSMILFARLTVFQAEMKTHYNYGAMPSSYDDSNDIAFGWECYECLLAQGVDVCEGFTNLTTAPWTDTVSDAFIQAMLGRLLMGHPLSELSRAKFAENRDYREKLYQAIKQLGNDDLIQAVLDDPHHVVQSLLKVPAEANSGCKIVTIDSALSQDEKPTFTGYLVTSDKRLFFANKAANRYEPIPMTPEQWQALSNAFPDFVVLTSDDSVRTRFVTDREESVFLRPERIAELSRITQRDGHEPDHLTALRKQIERDPHPFLRATLRPEIGQVSSEANSPVQQAFAAQPHFDPNMVRLITHLAGPTETKKTEAEDKLEANQQIMPIWAENAHETAKWVKATQVKAKLIATLSGEDFIHPKKETFLAELRKVFSPEALDDLLGKLANQIERAPMPRLPAGWSPGYFSPAAAEPAAAVARLSPDDPFVCLIREQCDEINLTHRIPSAAPPAAAMP